MLSQKQENFVQNLFLGLPQRDAYLKAGYSSNQTSVAIDVNACQLASSAKVVLRLKELRLPVANSNKMLVTEREDRLSEFGREDIEGKFGITRQSNIAAIQELNKMDGAYPVEKHALALLGGIDLVVRYIEKGED